MEECKSYEKIPAKNPVCLTRNTLIDTSTPCLHITTIALLHHTNLHLTKLHAYKHCMFTHHKVACVQNYKHLMFTHSKLHAYILQTLYASQYKHCMFNTMIIASLHNTNTACLHNTNTACLHIQNYMLIYYKHRMFHTTNIY